MSRRILGEKVAIILLSAPSALGYYAKIGLNKAENAFIIPREE